MAINHPNKKITAALTAAALSCCFAMLVSSSLSLAADYDGDEESIATFTYGAPCTQLSRFNHREIQAIVHSAHEEFFARFCTTESVYSCADFSAMLGGAGELEDNGLQGCRFVPEAM